MKELKEPKVITLNRANGETKNFIISKFPAMDGRKIATLYFASMIPKVGSYDQNEEISILMMNYVAIELPGHNQIRLGSRDLIDSHVYDFVEKLKIEALLMEYNCAFFRDGSLWILLQRLKQMLPASIIETSTLFLELLLTKIKQHFSNSNTITP